MIAAVAFVLVAALACILAVLAVFAISHIAMSGAEAVENDGLYRGVSAPVWSLPDSAGHIVRSPSARPLQLVVFTDHSLKSFPSVADGLKQVTSGSDDVEAVILLRSDNKIAAPVLRMMGLGEIPIVTGSPSLYGRYNVRVTPFMVFVDSAGLVRASSLVNHDWQVTKLRRLAALPLTDARPASGRRFRRLISAAEGQPP